ncbi:hypothetical protein B0T26DRAFT_689129 [Lasiosphaeria miniovina]|uniref:Uncharacterized protein n=1 Tax=Lasiosphaeria miniovina TaxID=1954250 RepID=A0AA40BI14_9PEZI|nr:uncharacterized protein B0T26DRAFT_689129 [Lasiosphaeria miniovina]KAK0734623.1 hypothetical protein B0T26DRAFT_689129 [Lasiosphaeria miniovina]
MTRFQSSSYRIARKHHGTTGIALWLRPWRRHFRVRVVEFVLFDCRGLRTLRPGLLITRVPRCVSSDLMSGWLLSVGVHLVLVMCIAGRILLPMGIAMIMLLMPTALLVSRIYAPIVSLIPEVVCCVMGIVCSLIILGCRVQRLGIVSSNLVQICPLANVFSSADVRGGAPGPNGLNISWRIIALESSVVECCGRWNISCRESVP